MSLTKWKTEEVLSAINGQIFGKNYKHIFTSIEIDSRKISLGSLFIAIKGENTNGVYFVSDAIKNGALGVILKKNDVKKLQNIQAKVTFILVKDPIRALGDLALYHRKRINVKLIAVTGSTGKTTTRQLISKISSQKYYTASTKGNMNNHIGLPLTLLKVKKHHLVVVLELGMSNQGEIKRLSEICQPDLGIITNVAPAHLETLGSIKNIAKAKNEIMEHINPKGTIILNSDDFLVKKMSQKTNLNVIFFGKNKKANIQGENILINNKGVSFLLKTPLGKINIKLNTSSKALVYNVLAASAAGIFLNCSNKEIKTGVESFKPTSGRMVKIKTNLDKIEIIDDTYNSNPISVRNAIETINLIKNNRFTIFVIGDMLELGKESNSIHYKIGKFIANSSIDRLYSTGFFSKYLIKGALDVGMSTKKIFSGNKESILEDIKINLKKNCIILIKGSRKTQMQKLVSEIINFSNLTKTTKISENL